MKQKLENRKLTKKSIEGGGLKEKDKSIEGRACRGKVS